MERLDVVAVLSDSWIRDILSADDVDKKLREYYEKFKKRELLSVSAWCLYSVSTLGIITFLERSTFGLLMSSLTIVGIMVSACLWMYFHYYRKKIGEILTSDIVDKNRIALLLTDKWIRDIAVSDNVKSALLDAYSTLRFKVISYFVIYFMAVAIFTMLLGNIAYALLFGSVGVFILIEAVVLLDWLRRIALCLKMFGSSQAAS